MRVSKQTTFDAAHLLPYHPGKCRNLHGHTWKVEVTCSGEVNPRTGMVIDFSFLKDFLDLVKDKFDHKNLNDTGLDNPTAEAICYFIAGTFSGWCKTRSLKWESVKVWEGIGSSSVELRFKDEILP